MPNEFLLLKDLIAYQKAVEAGKISWKIFLKMDWHEKKILGDQFICAVDSVGANIAEGYGRFRYMDRIKFYYNARGSLMEAKHWSLLLCNRKLINKEEFNLLQDIFNELGKQLNIFINKCKPKK